MNHSRATSRRIRADNRSRQVRHLNITYLHQYFNTPEMGGGTRSFEMGRRLCSLGHEVSVVTADCTGERGGPDWHVEDVSGMKVHWTPVAYSNHMSTGERLLSFASFALRASVRAVAIPADVIFATSTPLTIAIPGAWAARRQRAPMVLEVRDLWPDVPIALGALRNPVLRASAHWLEHFAYRNARHVVALAPGMKEDIVKKGYPDDRVSVIPNGADFDIFDVPTQVGARVREFHPWLGDRPLLLYAGTVGTVNGVDYLARLAAEMERVDPEIRFVVLGRGKEVARVRDFARDLGVLDKSFFMFDAVSKAEAATWLSACTMSVHLLTGPKVVWKDSVSNKYFDALAAGKPIASNFEGWSALLARDAGAGIIMDASDVRAEAERVAAYLRNTAWLETAATVARRLASQHFDRDMLARRLEEVLEMVVAGRNRSGERLGST